MRYYVSSLFPRQGLGRTRSHPWVFASAGDPHGPGPQGVQAQACKILVVYSEEASCCLCNWPPAASLALLQIRQILLGYTRPWPKPDSLKEVCWPCLMESPRAESSGWRPGGLASLPSSAPNTPALPCDLRSSTPLDCKGLLRGS